MPDKDLEKFARDLCIDVYSCLRESIYSSQRVVKERRVIDFIEANKHLIGGDILMTETAVKITEDSTADQLRAAGFKVKFYHRRMYLPDIKKWKRVYQLTAGERIGLKQGWKTREIINESIPFTGPYKEVPHRKTVMRSIREAIDTYGEKPPVHEHGGNTRVEITTPDGKVFEGETNCSVLDRYNKKLGRTIALRKALHSMLYNPGAARSPSP